MKLILFQKIKNIFQVLSRDVYKIISFAKIVQNNKNFHPKFMFLHQLELKYYYYYYYYYYYCIENDDKVK